MGTDNQEQNINYDEEPVRYCPRCYSLKIRYEESIDSDCCMECGCSDIEETDIATWEKMYQDRYGKKYVEKSTDLRKHWIFLLPVKNLMLWLGKTPIWEKVVKTFYPKFPNGLGKKDSLLLFFDKIIKDGNLDNLKFFIVKHLKNKSWK